MFVYLLHTNFSEHLYTLCAILQQKKNKTLVIEAVTSDTKFLTTIADGSKTILRLTIW